EDLDVLLSQLDTDIVQIQDTENEILAQLIKDLTEVKEESYGKSRDQQIQMLKTSYYLEQLKKEADNSKEKIQKIHDNLKKALGSRCAA
ncbi:338_t:CDS:2, partial [Ambispora leptoticha]